MPTPAENRKIASDFIVSRGGEPLDEPPTLELVKDEPPGEPEVPSTDEGVEVSSPEDEEARLAIEALGTDEEGASPAPTVDLSSLASTLGLDPTDFSLAADGQIRLKTKIDGQEGEVSLAELRKGYQLQRHFTQQQEAFLRERNSWEQARQQAEQQQQAQQVLAQEILNSQEDALRKEYTRDWQTLRQDDPAEYAAQVAEYNQKLTNIRQRKEQLMTDMYRRQQEHEQQWQQQYQAHLVQEGQKLVEALGIEPGKVTEEVRQAKLSGIMSYVQSQGISPQELAGVTNHKAYLIIEKARAYDDLQRRMANAKAKLAKPAPVPGGDRAASSTATAADKRIADLQKRAMDTGNLDDRVALLQATISKEARERAKPKR